jgi:hypothetical protein
MSLVIPASVPEPIQIAFSTNHFKYRKDASPPGCEHSHHNVRCKKRSEIAAL